MMFKGQIFECPTCKSAHYDFAFALGRPERQVPTFQPHAPAVTGGYDTVRYGGLVDVCLGLPPRLGGPAAYEWVDHPAGGRVQIASVGSAHAPTVVLYDPAK